MFVFLWSALLHEVAVGVPFRILKGWAFLAMAGQVRARRRWGGARGLGMLLQAGRLPVGAAGLSRKLGQYVHPARAALDNPLRLGPPRPRRSR